MNQRQRLISAIAHLAVLVAVSWSLFGVLVPPLGSAGAWFYAGIATLLLATALTEPFFARPADAVANGVAAVLVAVTYSPTVGLAEGASREAISSGKVALAVFGFVVAALGVVAIATKDSRYARISERTSRYCRMVGSGRVVYSVIYLLSVYATYSRKPTTLAVLVATWIVVVVVRPDDWVAAVITSRPRSEDARATVVGVRNPGLIEVSAPVSTGLQAGDVLRFKQGTDGVVLDVSANESGTWSLVSIGGDRLPIIGEDGSLHQRGAEGHAMLGVVEPGTDIQSMKFRAPGSVARVREGSVVRVQLREEDVLYQVVGATIRRETLSSPIEHRFVEISTRKIGRWVEDEDRFRSVPGLPQAGHPAYLQTVAHPGVRPEYIGTIPDTHFGIRVAADLLVTHNTAILGIGKTFLAFELIRRILLAGRKVVVLDITGQYSTEFEDVYSADDQARTARSINEAITANRNRVTKNVHEGGNLQDFRDAIRAELAAFLKGTERLRIYNPAGFDVVRQDSKPYADAASMAPLTTAEVTHWLAEELLGLMSDTMTAEARVCLVLEEAHSLVPEWNSTTYEGDQRASNGTARAILQGRKYGLGVVLITQRTANVTKTILNQCNTVFALRTFDATGMEFLRNYVGAEYADVLSGLEERTAVVFGRASSCETPVIVRLNDRDDMIAALWEPCTKEVVEQDDRNETSAGGSYGAAGDHPGDDADHAQDASSQPAMDDT